MKYTGEQASEAAHQAALAAPVCEFLYYVCTHAECISLQNWAPGASDQPKSALDMLKDEAGKTTDAAVAEGKHDVEAAYKHAKQLANSAVNTAAVSNSTSLIADDLQSNLV